MELRRSVYYPTAGDEQYWGGGLHELLDADTIGRRHRADPDSHFALVRSPDGALQAYARFSFTSHLSEWPVGAMRPSRLAEMHVVVASATARSHWHQWSLPHGRFVDGRVGAIVYEEVCRLCSAAGCEAILAEVAVSPVPNLASLVLHRKLGFSSLQLPPRIHVRPEGGGQASTVHFLRLLKWLRQRSAC
jgi:hypothetical protein